MNTFRLSKKAIKQLKKLDANNERKIAGKIRSLKKHPFVFSILEPITDLEPATHRLRIGDYRALIRSEGDGQFIILKIGHRSKIYC